MIVHRASFVFLFSFLIYFYSFSFLGLCVHTVECGVLVLVQNVIRVRQKSVKFSNKGVNCVMF